MAVTTTAGAEGSTPPRVAAALLPPPVPHGAYLGVAPLFAPTRTTSSQTFQFEKETGRALGIVSYYIDFDEMPPFSDVKLVAARGTLPMISMKCGAPDTAVAAGHYDARLRVIARAFKQYARPVLFRWFWEMNLSKVNGHPACLGTAGGPGYIAAYRHIWTIFHQVGAANVAFVWCPSAAHGVPHRFDMTFYPGNSYVDWIGFDMYDRTRVRGTFAEQVDSFYWYWTHHSGGKPIVYSETGANDSSAQTTWLQEIAAALTKRVSNVPGTPFKNIHGVVYWDGVGIYNYVLVPGTTGFAQFSKLAHETYFSALAG